MMPRYPILMAALLGVGGATLRAQNVQPAAAPLGQQVAETLRTRLEQVALGLGPRVRDGSLQAAVGVSALAAQPRA